MSNASERKEKQKWAFAKPKLDNARKLRGIHFIDLDDGEFKDIMKNARRKLEVAKFNVRSTGQPLALERIARQSTLA